MNLPIFGLFLYLQKGLHNIMKKQKIIISNYDDIKNPYYSGGGASAIHEVAKRLVQLYDVFVITGKYPRGSDEVIDGVVYKRVGFSFSGPKLSQLIFHFVLPFYAIAQDFDLWIESFTPPFSTSFLPLFTKKPVIALVHMLSAEEMKRKYKLPFPLIEKMGLKIYQRFIVMTQKAKERIEVVNKNANIKVIPNGIDLPKRIKKVRKEHILFIGRIDVNQKGLDLLLKAYQKIFSESTPKLLIAGSGTKKEENKLGRLIKDNNVGGYVEYIGRVSGVRKTEIFERAFLVVIPSRFEEFSIVALEAVSYGLPVVSFDIGGLSWIPRECAMKVEPFNEKDMGRAILELVTNKRLRIKKGDVGRRLAEKYSWDIAYANYLDFVEKALMVRVRRAYA